MFPMYYPQLAPTMEGGPMQGLFILSMFILSLILSSPLSTMFSNPLQGRRLHFVHLLSSWILLISLQRLGLYTLEKIDLFWNGFIFIFMPFFLFFTPILSFFLLSTLFLHLLEFYSSSLLLPIPSLSTFPFSCLLFLVH